MKIEIEVIDKVFEFSTFEDWVNNAKKRFRKNNVYQNNTICVDGSGNLCVIGKNFMKARDDNAFPVKVYRVGF